MLFYSQLRRILCQVMIAMAHHDYLSLEGGHLMVEFVVRQSSLNTEDRASEMSPLLVHSKPLRYRCRFFRNLTHLRWPSRDCETWVTIFYYLSPQPSNTWKRFLAYFSSYRVLAREKGWGLTEYICFQICTLLYIFGYTYASVIQKQKDGREKWRGIKKHNNNDEVAGGYNMYPWFFHAQIIMCMVLYSLQPQSYWQLRKWKQILCA